MGVCNAGFELGVTGATIATTDPGDGDAWNLVSVVTGGTLIYDTTHVALGAQACKVATGGTAGVAVLRWDNSSALGTVTDHYGRAYFYFTAFPAGIVHFVNFTPDAAGACRLGVNTSGKLLILDVTNAIVATSTNAIATGQWIRVEWHIVHSTTVGQGEVVLYNTATSGTPTETLTTAANKNLAAAVTRVNFGAINSVANVAPFWMDSIVAGATSYPGVAAVGVPSRTLLGVG